MKKLILSAGVLFALFACSDEAIQEVEKQDSQSEIPIKPSTSDPVLNFESPYNGPSSPVIYRFINNSPLTFSFYPLVGLAYYDPASPNNFPNYFGTPATAFPNFYDATTGKYGELRHLTPITVNPFTSEDLGASGPQSQLYTSGAVTTASGQYFDMTTVLYEPSSPPTEVQLFEDYGKLFGIEYAIQGIPMSYLKFGPFTGGVFQPGSTDWDQVALNPGMDPNSLWRNINSNEIVFPNGPYHKISQYDSQVSFNYMGTTYTLRLYTTSTEVIIELS